MWLAQLTLSTINQIVSGHERERSCLKENKKGMKRGAFISREKEHFYLATVLVEDGEFWTNELTEILPTVKNKNSLSL